MILAIYGGSGVGKTYLLNKFFNAPAHYNCVSVFGNKKDVVCNGSLIYLPEISSGSLSPIREKRLNTILDLDTTVVTDVNANGGFAGRFFRVREMRNVILLTDENTLRNNLNSRDAFDPSKSREEIVEQTMHTQFKLLQRGWEALTPYDLIVELNRIALTGNVDIGSTPYLQAPPKKDTARLSKEQVLNLVASAPFKTVGELSDEYGIEPMSVRRILRGGRWGRITGIANTWRGRRK